MLSDSGRKKSENERQIGDELHETISINWNEKSSARAATARARERVCVSLITTCSKPESFSMKIPKADFLIDRAGRTPSVDSALIRTN